MPHATHPDDERLAASAGADRGAVSDRALAAHLDTCERCRSIVDELSVLRDRLATLPDVAPPRPLRLIPPVAAPTARPSGPLEWVRRLAAPAMAAGAGLVLVGAVGASGIVGGLSGKTIDTSSGEAASSNAFGPNSGGARSQVPAMSTDGDISTRTDAPRSQSGGDLLEPTPTPSEGQEHGVAGDASEEPWLTLLVAGFGLFGISAILRHSLAPRAG